MQQRGEAFSVVVGQVDRQSIEVGRGTQAVVHLVEDVAGVDPDAPGVSDQVADEVLHRHTCSGQLCRNRFFLAAQSDEAAQVCGVLAVLSGDRHRLPRLAQGGEVGARAAGDDDEDAGRKR